MAVGRSLGCCAISHIDIGTRYHEYCGCTVLDQCNALIMECNGVVALYRDPIHSEGVADTLRIEVHDEGPGISEVSWCFCH